MKCATSARPSSKRMSNVNLPSNFCDTGLRSSGIYAIICTETGKTYVGSSRNLYVRWRRHFYRLNKGTHENKYLQCSWIKHGHENFCFRVLEFCLIECLAELERKHCNLVPRYLQYNIRLEADSCRGLVHSSEARAKMRAARVGYTHSSETRAKLSAATKRWMADPRVRTWLSVITKRRMTTPEARDNIRVANRRRVITLETRAKLSASSRAAFLKAGRHASKLTVNQIVEIRHAYANGLAQRQLAERYGVDKHQISLIVRRKNWANVE